MQYLQITLANPLAPPGTSVSDPQARRASQLGSWRPREPGCWVFSEVSADVRLLEAPRPFQFPHPLPGSLGEFRQARCSGCCSCTTWIVVNWNWFITMRNDKGRYRLFLPFSKKIYAQKNLLKKSIIRQLKPILLPYPPAEAVDKRGLLFFFLWRPLRLLFEQ